MDFYFHFLPVNFCKNLLELSSNPDHFNHYTTESTVLVESFKLHLLRALVVSSNSFLIRRKCFILKKN